VPDCIYRLDPADGEPLYASEAAIFGPIADAEAGLVVQLAGRLAALPAAGRIYLPLGVGGHADHRLLRRAAEAAWRPDFGPYYEEYPYARQPGAVTAALGGSERWRAEVVSLTPAALGQKIAAIACYGSQLGTFFGRPADMARQVTEYAAAVDGERYWWPVIATIG
jgi:hypothetical protein